MPARIGVSPSGVGVLLALVLGACSGQSQASPSPTVEPVTAPVTTRTPTAPAASSPSVAPPTITGPSYTNPVFASDFPDPHVILVDDTYYAYSTNSANQNVPIISSANLADWQRERDGMPALPSWAMPNFGNTWAPGVIQLRDGFVLYYVARNEEADKQCIGVAVSDSPIGPFVDESDEPLVCQLNLGGSIDPYPFRDEDGRLYLLWKNDGNCCAKPVDLWVQPLSEDGLILAGEPVALVRRDQPWEIPLIENPALVLDEGTYYLFYSGNRWETHEYAVGYAVCETVTGPCEKPLDEPIFTWTLEVMGPGGQAFFNDADGQLWMVYHAWTGPHVGYPQGQRSMRIEPAGFEDGRPVIDGPTSDAQPLL